jgi:hypothetical protein
MDKPGAPSSGGRAIGDADSAAGASSPVGSLDLAVDLCADAPEVTDWDSCA